VQGANFRYRRIPIPTPVVQAIERRRFDLAWDRFIKPLDACLFPGLWVRPLRHGGNVRVVFDLNHVIHPETLPAVVNAARDWIGNFERTLPALDTIFAISHAVRTEIIEHFDVDAARIEVAPPAADTGVFYPRPAGAVERVRAAYGLPGDYVLHTGTLEPRKNTPALIAAFNLLAGGRRDLTLALAGPGGWGTADVMRAIDEAAAQGVKVRWLGYVPTDDLAALYTGARAFAFPSTYEGFGMPVLEAMACGTPVVTAAGPALREVSGGAALHVDAADTVALADALARVLDDEALRAGMIEQGHQRVAAYSWERSARLVRDALVRAASR
jgi:alpha-1,3-rhamnosyl/mannosyltransferase